MRKKQELVWPLRGGRAFALLAPVVGTPVEILRYAQDDTKKIARNFGAAIVSRTLT
jgi:hypothetical protein